MAISLGGCAASAPVGRSATPVQWTFGALVAELPTDVPVQTAAAAAEVTLRNRGYTITQRGQTADTVELLAEGATNGAAAPVLVRTTAGPNATLLVLKVGLFGDETASRHILLEMLRALGRG